MEYDISLWNGNFAHLTERPLFRSLGALVTVLRASPGPKAVVFVSAELGTGDFYDLDFDRLAAAASDAQVSFYTVDARGSPQSAPDRRSAGSRQAGLDDGRTADAQYERRHDRVCRGRAAISAAATPLGFTTITRRPTSGTRSASIAAGRACI
jgi:hypothetical protein